MFFGLLAAATITAAYIKYNATYQATQIQTKQKWLTDFIKHIKNAKSIDSINHPDFSKYGGYYLRLDLCDKGLTDFDIELIMAEIENNPTIARNITFLFLSSNLLTKAPKVSMCDALIKLHLGDNQITQIHDLSECTAMYIDLFSNCLTDATIDLFLLKNKICEYSSEVESYAALQTLIYKRLATSDISKFLIQNKSSGHIKIDFLDQKPAQATSPQPIIAKPTAATIQPYIHKKEEFQNLTTARDIAPTSNSQISFQHATHQEAMTKARARTAQQNIFKFSTKKSIQEHFDRHSHEFGYQDADSYESAANEVITKGKLLRHYYKDELTTGYTMEKGDGDFRFVAVKDNFITTYYTITEEQRAERLARLPRQETLLFTSRLTNQTFGLVVTNTSSIPQNSVQRAGIGLM